MANIGLCKPTMAKRESKGKYTGAVTCGAAIEVHITPQYAEGENYGDNMLRSKKKKFVSANIELVTDSLPVKAHELLFGNTINEVPEEGKFQIEHNIKDQSNQVGFGLIMEEEDEKGDTVFVASWLYKCQFNEPEVIAKSGTKSIEYQNPKIAGICSPEDDGSWKKTVGFATEAEAIAFIDKMKAQGAA